MRKPQLAPYGAWRSPIGAEQVAGAEMRLSEIRFDGSDLYWLEGRPSERGRQVIVGAGPADVIPAPFNARTSVHEYGGGAYAVDQGVVYFAHFADQRVYRQEPGAAPQPITPALALRYADFAVDRRRDRLLCVREDHRDPTGPPINTLVALDAAGDAVGGRVLAAGADFYAAPRLSPDGARLAWLSWDHPNMPWDGTTLWVAELNAAGAVTQATAVAGGIEESILQPEWGPDGSLYFVSDRTGWWNLYRRRAGRVAPLAPMAAEFGAPQWLFGQSTYAVESPRRIVCTYAQGGGWRLAALDPETAAFEPFDLPYTEISAVRAADGRACFLAAAPALPTAVVELDLTTRQTRIIRPAENRNIDSGYLSAPRPIEFPTEGGLTAHALFYPPANRDFAAPPGELPPLIVFSHGGPTSSASTAFSLRTQFWTSRGFAVVDVNYGGSAGYGRVYRQRLNGAWGVVDVDDCANAARYLVARGEADGNRLIIRGSSAGGYTTLAALTFRDVFRAGASYYGIGDLEALNTDTHKFESRYNDRLIGPWPERRDLYIVRSPIHFTERLACPVIFFQGLEDRVVPPAQSERMVAALRARGVPTEYLTFPDEGHGFRHGENIRRALDAELAFYARVFGIPLADSAPITADQACAMYQRSGGSHDFDHVLRVTTLAERIAAAEGADRAVVRTAALLHDIGESASRPDHHLRGAEMAREILGEQPAAFVDAVAHAIEAHRFRAEPAPRTLEAQILSDADKLDAIGAVGVARAFAYAGAQGTALWRAPWREIAAAGGDAATQPQALGADYTPVHEFVYKLDRIPERLYTATARAIAAERRRFMQAFFDRLDEEMSQ